MKQRLAIRKNRARLSEEKKDAGQPCRVLVANERTFHYEILESVAVLFPFKTDKTACESSTIVVDFLVVYEWNYEWLFSDPKKILEESVVGQSWVTYMNATFGQHTAHNRTAPGDTWRLGWIKKYSIPLAEESRSHSATVLTSCYCEGNEEKGIASAAERLRSYPNSYCILHEACPDGGELVRQRSWFLTPMNGPRWLFPTHLPPRPKGTPPDPLPVQLCVIGHVDRRNLGLAARTLEAMGPLEGKFVLNLLGKGEVPPSVTALLGNKTVRHREIEDFRSFYGEVCRCHVLLALVEPDLRPQYFPPSRGGGGKLTGTVVLAAAYGIPVVLHKALAAVYRGLLPADLVYAYTGDASFGATLRRALRRHRPKLQEASRTFGLKNKFVDVL